MKINSTFYIALAISTGLWACQTKKIKNDLSINMPDTYRTELSVTPDSSIGNIPWRTFFQDPVLQDLIDTAILQNVDLQMAIKNIEIAQLLLRQAKAANIPAINLQVQGTTTNPSKNSLNGLSLGEFLKQSHIEDYTAALGFSWEADIWGKIKTQKAAALASYLRTEEARKAVQTQIVSQVTNGYYQLLMLYQLREIAEQNLTLIDNTLKMARHQYEVGDISLLAVEQVAAQRLTAAALIPDFEQQIQIQENALRVLSGEFPKEINITAKLADIRLPLDIKVGIPAELLSKRPDVKQAELSVTAAEAFQQSAKAQMYPSLSITAQAGINAFKASNWFNIPASLFGALGGSVTQPILQRRELKTKYEVARVDYEKNVMQFRQSVVNAVGEVADALVSIEKLQDRHQIVQEKADKLKGAIKHADLLFETGTASYLEVITAQSNALQSELELAQIHKAELSAIVSLYRALGGGYM